jgi:hypothetical protein
LMMMLLLNGFKPWRREESIYLVSLGLIRTSLLLSRMFSCLMHQDKHISKLCSYDLLIHFFIL